MAHRRSDMPLLVDSYFTDIAKKIDDKEELEPDVEICLNELSQKILADLIGKAVQITRARGSREIDASDLADASSSLLNITIPMLQHTDDDMPPPSGPTENHIEKLRMARAAVARQNE